MQAANTYPCPLCLSEEVAADRKACDTCVELFQVADDKATGGDAKSTAQRLPIGPTDV